MPRKSTTPKSRIGPWTSYRLKSGKFASPETMSPWVRSLKAEYENQGLHQWTTAKVRAVCKLFHCKLEELCALVGVFNAGTIALAKMRNHWPMSMTIQWDRMVRLKLGAQGLDPQSAYAAKFLNWKDGPAPEPETLGCNEEAAA